MRLAASGFLSLALLGASSLGANAACSSPADQATFDVQALKSMLIVLSTSCKSSEPYNAFVRRYPAELKQSERAMGDYFRRAYGKRGQTEQDSYITSLANDQFRVGLQQGTDFCPRNQAIFEEAVSLRSGGDLPAYAAGKNLIPDSIGACPGVSTASTSGPARATKSRAHKN